MKTRIPIVTNLALVLVLLAASLPTDVGSAQTSEPFCPPPFFLENPDLGFIETLPKECRKQSHAPAAPQLRTLNQIIPLSSGGPDGFGYTYDDTVTFTWVDVLGGNSFSGADDQAFGPIDFGSSFSFPFYGSNYTSLYIGSNGLITFGQSACCNYGGGSIPNTAAPNNYIAPFWEDLVMGAPYNSGAIWYVIGGTAPDRYIAVEWRDVTTYAGSDPFTFQVLLFENGDILVQYQSLPAEYYSTVGIENAQGDDGLQYQSGDSGLTAPIAIRFFHPIGPIARVQVTPLTNGRFARTNADTFFPLTITNTGTAGADTYDLTAVSTWGTGFYQDGCVTPLTDTDADTTPDTGPIAEGDSATICVGFTPPPGAGIGDVNNALVSVTSSLDPIKTKTAQMHMAIPTAFAQVFEDNGNAAPAFRLNQPEGTLTNYPTADFHYAEGLTTIQLPLGGYVYAWHRKNNPNVFNYSDIEYTFLSDDGATNTPVAKLTSNAANTLTMDFLPALAVTPGGTVGVVWYRFLANNPGSGFVYNFNIYFAALTSTGSLLSGPTNITNNTLWDDYDDINVPDFRNPVIAATDDNRFVISWEDQRTDGAGTYESSIWYSTLDVNGMLISAPTQLSNPGQSYGPILNPLKGEDAILTLHAFDDDGFSSYYAVIASDGTLTKPLTDLDPNRLYYPFTAPDAVNLSNGNTALAWPTFSGIALTILDANYDTIQEPAFTSNPFAFENASISLTRDADDRIVLTWVDINDIQLFYALADSTGMFLTEPTPMRISPLGLVTSYNGQGNAPHLPVIINEPLDVNIDIKPYNPFNIISLKELLVPVAILSTQDFRAPRDVDRDSLTFGKTGDEDSLVFCLRYGRFINRDKLPDLLCYFRIQKAGFAYGDTAGFLKGLTVDGTPIEGSDRIKVLRPFPHK